MYFACFISNIFTTTLWSRSALFSHITAGELSWGKSVTMATQWGHGALAGKEGQGESDWVPWEQE